jgi:uncharacterized protein YegJ (DUF2314 family)
MKVRLGLGWSKRSALLLSALLHVACAGSGVASGGGAASANGARGPRAPVSALRAKAFRYRFAVYLEQAPPAASQTVGELASQYGFLMTDASLPPTLPPIATTLSVAEPPIEKFAVPPAEHFAAFTRGLDAQEARRLLASRAVVTLELLGPGASAFDDYRKALLLARDLCGQWGGIPWDEETRVAYGLSSWQRRSDSWQGGIPDINEQVVIHQYQDEHSKLVRLVSLGMVKLGLPDLVVNDVTQQYSRGMGLLMDLVMQRLAEGEVPDAQGRLSLSFEGLQHAGQRARLSEDASENAKRATVVTLRLTEPEEGDADNRLFEVVFPNHVDQRQELQAATLKELFGSEETVVYVENDAELLAASARARKKAQSHAARFANGTPYGETLLVKAPFAVPGGGQEWIWVEVVRWHGDVISGVLTEDAFEIPDLKAGKRLEVKAGEIFDYVLLKRDGTREGNETQVLLEKRERARKTK